MPTFRLLCSFCAGAVLWTAGPALAGSGDRRAGPRESPRAGWLDRFTEARQGPEQVERITRTFPVGAAGALDLAGISGDVQVTGGAGTDIRIEATKRVRHRDPAEARRLLSTLQVDMTLVGSRVDVRTVYPRWRGDGAGRESASVDYVVAVPTGTSVTVKAISGNVSVQAVTGEVRTETISGDVTATGTPNLVLAKTVSGDVTARDIGAPSALTLGTVSGTIVASGLRVRSLDCGSVSGDVRLSGLQAERVEAKSVSGNIEFDAPLSRNGRYAFTSHSGSVRVVLSGDVGFDLDASTFGGSIRSDVPVTLQSVGGRRDGDRGRGRSDRSLRGSYGDGSAVLMVRTFSGTVVLAKK